MHEPPPTIPAWEDPQRRRRELRVVLGFCLLLLVSPPIALELYPFSAPSMFSRSTEYVVNYHVSSPNGASLDAEPFGLAVFHTRHQDPDVDTFGRSGWGRIPPPSIYDEPGVHSRETVVALVRERLREMPEHRRVKVVQVVVGAKNDRELGLLSVEHMEIRNPLYE